MGFSETSIESDPTFRSLSGLAHDFNNALAIILSNVGFAIEDLDPTHPVVIELREIQAAAQRAATLTKQLARRATKVATLAPPMRSARSITALRLVPETATDAAR